MRFRYSISACLAGAVLALAACAPGADVPNDEIRIMLAAPLTGASAETGNDMVHGAEIAAAYLNEQGGVTTGPLAGKRFVIVPVDDQESTQTATTLAARFADDASLFAMTGFITSGQALAAGVVTNRYHLPIVVSFASADFLTEKSDNLILISASVADYARASAKFATQVLGAKTVGSIAGDYTFLDTYYKGLDAQLRASSAESVSRQTYPDGSTDFSSMITNLKTAAPDVIMSGAFQADAGKIAAQVRSAGIMTPFVDFLGEGWGATFAASAGSALNKGDYYEMNPANIFPAPGSLAEQVDRALRARVWQAHAHQRHAHLRQRVVHQGDDRRRCHFQGRPLGLCHQGNWHRNTRPHRVRFRTAAQGAGRNHVQGDRSGPKGSSTCSHLHDAGGSRSHRPMTALTTTSSNSSNADRHTADDPTALAGNRTLWALSMAISAGFLAPLFVQSRLTMQVLALAYINAAVVAGLVLSLGYTGLLNLSQGTFYGLGAYTTAILVTDHGMSFGFATLCGMVVAGAAGILLALASARVKGDYFVLVSLAITIAVAQLIANLPDLTRGREGFFGLPPMSILGLRFDNALHTYYICLLLLVLSYTVVRRISQSFLGRAMLVVRYDDVAARSMGISPFQVRAMALVLSAMIAGLAGSVLVGTLQFIRPDDFDFNSSFMFTLYVIIGGMASLPGAVVVAMGFAALNEQFTTLSDYRVGLIGLIVIAVVFWRGAVIKDAVVGLLHGRRKSGDRRA